VSHVDIAVDVASKSWDSVEYNADEDRQRKGRGENADTQDP